MTLWDLRYNQWGPLHIAKLLTWGEAGDIWRAEGRGSHLLLIPVFKRLSNLSFYLIATDKLGSDKSDSQLASVKIATQIYAASWGFPNNAKPGKAGQPQWQGFHTWTQRPDCFVWMLREANTLEIFSSLESNCLATLLLKTGCVQWWCERHVGCFSTGLEGVGG